MVQKAGSGTYRTSFPDPDSTEFTHDLEEYSAPDFPERLKGPMRVDLALLARIDAAQKADGIGGLSLWSRWYACQVEELRARWMELFDFYKITARAPEDAWMQLATSLARDFVPGLRVENVFPTQDLLMEQARLFTLITEVSEAVRARSEAEGHNVSERMVLEQDFLNEQPWNNELFGKKPDSIDALMARFSREKERFARLLIEQYWSKAAVMSFFADSGLEAPAFVADLPA
ncbi:hypothetical protein NB311A_11337 [Nitrobacter sp. Nb-311A]|uniref:hypothetical protein n=1 Tax=unclassified Nitrobacter TaxID=2620411 RepID=UPI0000686609|nr:MULTISPECIES: hypothetical protein [unclassified Nitrobacter]EAQ36031.1 hypothetical protein NB311A_11337 [Nitrobacter sp. Nb-311A]MCV0385815.1 hypothetical protein [Nitrobacter sp.]